MEKDGMIIPKEAYPANRKVSKKRRSPTKIAIVESVECIICMENFQCDDINGMNCPAGHFICQQDMISYVTENVFPQVYKLRESKCGIQCPGVNCICEYNALDTYKRLPAREKARYQSMISELVLASDNNLKMLHSSLVDLMTLKCPTCKTTVDPLPDACSAVMCLNCGNHYCNYCFEGFASGQSDKDRAAAHEHTASHHESDRPGGRDAFLPAELVLRGHKEFRFRQLVKCLYIAMQSTEFGVRGRHDVALSLIICSKELDDLGIDIYELWNAADSKCMALFSVDMPISPSPETLSSENEDSDSGRDSGPGESSTPLKHRIVKAKSPSPGSSNSLRGGQQLANAILTNNSAAVVQLIESYRDELDLDYVDKRHGHPLTTLAILSGQIWAAKLLLEKGADPVKVNKGGRTVLYIAIEAGVDEIVRLVLEKYPHLDINAPITQELQRYCPIHVAARNNHGSVARLLVEFGANLDLEESEHGYTPLMLALVLGHEWVAAELILAGANVRYLASNGRSPMFVAAEKGLSSIISLMVLHCGIGVNEPAVRPSGLRMIHVAAFHKQPLIVSQLIRLGANVNQFDDENGYSPLSMAILGLNSAAAIELINAGADIYQPSRSGRTPLYVAIEKGLTDVVKLLLSMPGIDINAPVTSERSAARPLHVAILYGQSHLIPLLIGLGADVNLPDDERRCSPLLMATLLKDAWSAKLLLRSNADPCVLSKEGRSAFYIAAEKGFSGILRLLYEESIDVDINGSVTSETHRGTALHIAAMFDNAHTILELVSLGADINVVDALGRSPVQVAREMSSTRAEYVLSRLPIFPIARPSFHLRHQENLINFGDTTQESMESDDNEDRDNIVDVVDEINYENQPKLSHTENGNRPILANPLTDEEASLTSSTPLPRRNANDNPRRGQSSVSHSDSATTEQTTVKKEKQSTVIKQSKKEY